MLIVVLMLGSPDDWEYFLHYLDCLLEDDSRWCKGNVGDQTQCSKVVVTGTCNLSHLTDEAVHAYAHHFLSNHRVMKLNKCIVYIEMVNLYMGPMVCFSNLLI